MKHILSLTGLFLLIRFSSHAQTADDFYKAGQENLRNNQLQEAAENFTKCIDLQPENYYAWFNRGICYNRLKEYEKALPDFNQTVKLAPTYKKVYVSRSNTKRHLQDYAGSLADCNLALALDSNYAEAYYNRSLIFVINNKKDSACIGFKKARDLGLSAAKNKADSCEGKPTRPAVLKLVKTATDDSYAFSSKNPVKVGTGTRGGPASEREYLDLLRDAQGNPITYERKGSCCAYSSASSPFGLAMVDHYEITYHNAKGKKKTTDLYISFYDYEEPMIPVGFKTVE